ncbi:hypothetical protein AXX12_11345 [Anaerosporomusa subterranea]|uniref:Tyr recombinase domain-containing protein n=1 Tax=Anaerosporomusa subterranea TaxID=1794912 RepID=A0A154BQK5_ANASB|nr:site-specific integrase [Anaerosporomusa subterranea]KYZ75788.1 hypothetical protein AXX12_11345 [Anaerosporomusa subterranea]
MHSPVKGLCFFMAKKGSKLIGIEQDLNPFSLIIDFLNARKAQGITSFTLSSLRSALTQFFTAYKGNIRNDQKLNQAVTIFLSDKKAGYYNKLLQALRQFFDYCICEQILKRNPCEGIRFKRETARIVQHDQSVIRALLTLPDQSTFAGLRDYAFILTMLDTGIRPNELLQICIRDVDLINVQLIVREEYSKTRQMRTLPISIQTVQVIKRLIYARHEDWSMDTPVFSSFSGNRLTSHNFQERFRQYSKQLGVNITPYHLRHVFALWFIRNGGNLFALQKIMGHTKLDMTRNYVELVQADIKASHEKASPLSNIFIRKDVVRKI